MDKQGIIDYVMETPGNTNPAILGQMIDGIGGSGNSEYILEVTATYYTDKTIVSNATALLEAVRTKHPSFIRFIYDDTVIHTNLQISVLNLWADLYTDEAVADNSIASISYGSPNGGLTIGYEYTIGDPNSEKLSVATDDFTGLQLIPNENDELIANH